MAVATRDSVVVCSPFTTPTLFFVRVSRVRRDRYYSVQSGSTGAILVDVPLGLKVVVAC